MNIIYGLVSITYDLVHRTLRFVYRPLFNFIDRPTYILNSEFSLLTSRFFGLVTFPELEPPVVNVSAAAYTFA